ncbi:ribosomal-protein-alanine N-acetyltransferase [Puccinia sorghi]|uniref:Ribosomal-protein-alanine N-acetyltransferase n=1 Tax=Puccinia sorghi TaxID=27349 RepID=A0A0L6V0X6_9BASI|nr:ribosomal-protein-alanine N-acetyltransferase [Puccinia sorghi]
MTEQCKQAVAFRPYDADSEDLNQIINLVESELSEPYIIVELSLLFNQRIYKDSAHFFFEEAVGAHHADPPPRAIGAIVCKQDVHRGKLNRGYIAMLTIKKEARMKGIARRLVQMAMQRMIADGAQEIVLETEFDNRAALAFYQKLGFIREKRLYAFYLNHKDAFRLVYPIDSHAPEHQDDHDPYT